MIFEAEGLDIRRSRIPIELELHPSSTPSSSCRIMDGVGREKRKIEASRTELRRSLSAAQGIAAVGGGGWRRRFFGGGGKSYFSLESMALLVCLTASLLILPVVLPPLPPPPLMLLLLPIGILAVLLMLAFMPSANVRDVAYTAYV